MNRSHLCRFLLTLGLFLSASGAAPAETAESGRAPVSEGAQALWSGVVEVLDHLVATLWSDNGGSLDPFGQPRSQGSAAPQDTGSPDSGD